jgi:hypothetical protein
MNELPHRTCVREGVNSEVDEVGSPGVAAEGAVGAGEYSPGRKPGVSRLIATSPGRGGRSGTRFSLFCHPCRG